MLQPTLESFVPSCWFSPFHPSKTPFTFVLLLAQVNCRVLRTTTNIMTKRTGLSSAEHRQDSCSRLAAAVVSEAALIRSGGVGRAPLTSTTSSFLTVWLPQLESKSCSTKRSSHPSELSCCRVIFQRFAVADAGYFEICGLSPVSQSGNFRIWGNSEISEFFCQSACITLIDSPSRRCTLLTADVPVESWLCAVWNTTVPERSGKNC